MSDIEQPPSERCGLPSNGIVNKKHYDKAAIALATFVIAVLGLSSLLPADPKQSTATAGGHLMATSASNRKLATFTLTSLTSVTPTTAIDIYMSFCPQFETDGSWGGACSGGEASATLILEACSPSQETVISSTSLANKRGKTWRYTYGDVQISCRDGGSSCSVTGLSCSAVPATPSPTPAPVVSTAGPTPVPVAATPSPTSGSEPNTSSMPVVSWSASNTATIEFCQSGSTYGYRLPGETGCGPAGVVVRMMPGTDYIMTVQNTASVPTNVHTHGLHISGDGNADDPTRYVDAGCSLKYHWNIPSDHMGGTYWMHAHRHTTTQTQVSGGAFAMVIIEEQAGVANSVSNTVSRQNVLDWTTKELLLVASKVGSTKRGNGLTDESFDVFAGEWYRLRVAAVDPKGRRSDLVIDGCEARAVAYDGVWREQVPANAASTYSLTGASRIDLAIKCDSSGTVKFDRAVIATLNVASGSSSKPGATPFVSGGTWSPVRPDYLRDLSQEPSSLFEIYAIGMTAAQINGDSYDPDVPLRTFNYGTLQEWDISGSGAHPYHLHVYHMQVVSGCGDHEVGQYYDTISGSGSCTVRFHMTGIAERIMMHCHVLAHEDNGAMTWVDVINGGPTQSTVDREQFGCPA